MATLSASMPWLPVLGHQGQVWLWSLSSLPAPGCRLPWGHGSPLEGSVLLGLVSMSLRSQKLPNPVPATFESAPGKGTVCSRLCWAQPSSFDAQAGRCLGLSQPFCQEPCALELFLLWLSKVTLRHCFIICSTHSV